MLEPGRRPGCDPFTRRHRPGDRDLRNRRVPNQRGADVTAALHDVERSDRQPRLGEDLGERQRRERRDLGRLEDHRVARSECRRRLPAGDLDRVVPGTDPDAHAQRLATGVGERSARCPAEVDVLAGGGGRERAEVLETVGARRGIGDERLLERLAGVERLEHRQLTIAGSDQIGGAMQDRDPARRRERPTTPRTRGRRNPPHGRSSPRRRHRARR